MELTGKAKEAFNEWYDNPLRDEVALRRSGNYFNQFTYSMKYGVYVDWFDSVGIELSISYSVAGAIGTKTGWWAEINNRQFHPTVSTRPEARTQAIKKGNELYNEQHA